jgi:hypothetical protein
MPELAHQQGGIYGVIQWGEPAKRSGSAEPGAQSAPARGRRPSGGRVQGGGSPPPAKGVRGYNPRKIFEILYAKSCIQRHIQTNKLIR